MLSSDRAEIVVCGSVSWESCKSKQGHLARWLNRLILLWVILWGNWGVHVIYYRIQFLFGVPIFFPLSFRYSRKFSLPNYAMQINVFSIMKEYIKINKLQQELIRSLKKMLTWFMFTFAKRWIQCNIAHRTHNIRTFWTQTTSAPFLTVWADSQPWVNAWLVLYKHWRVFDTTSKPNWMGSSNYDCNMKYNELN